VIGLLDCSSRWRSTVFKTFVDGLRQVDSDLDMAFEGEAAEIGNRWMVVLGITPH
jgi:hypothetical protein